MKRSFLIGCIVATLLVSYLRLVIRRVHPPVKTPENVAVMANVVTAQSVPAGYAVIMSTKSTQEIADGDKEYIDNLIYQVRELETENRMLADRLGAKETSTVILGNVHKGSNLGYAQVGNKVCFTVEGNITRGCLTIKK